MGEELSRAVRLREEGELEEARNLLVKLAKEEPENPTVHYQAAWVHDVMGREREAIPFYEQAIATGLSGEELEESIVGLGSSHRALGEYDAAVRMLREGAGQFPENRAMRTFLAMALYNVGEHREATRLLLENLAETSEDPGISTYAEAISFYAGRLDEVWE